MTAARSEGSTTAPRVLVLFSDIGEGHAATARAVAAELSLDTSKPDVVQVNGLTAMGWFLRFLQKDLYHAQLQRAPWLYGFLYGLFDSSRVLRAAGAFVLCAFGCRPLRRLVLAHAPDVVISTDPRVSVALGHLRMRSKISMPVCATLTDLGGLKFWVHPGVDVHLASHPRMVPEVERLIGPGSVRLIRPPVHPRFYLPLEKAEARERLDLSPEATVVLVSGGGWGAGDFRGALLAALAIRGGRVMCLCGRNQDLKAKIETMVSTLGEAAGQVRVLGFTEKMSELLAAADVLIHSTGGATCLEASVRRCPVIMYGAPHGHPRHVARAMAHMGEAALAGSTEELSQLLREVACGRGICGADTSCYPAAGQIILSARPRVHSWRSILLLEEA